MLHKMCATALRRRFPLKNGTSGATNPITTAVRPYTEGGAEKGESSGQAVADEVESGSAPSNSLNSSPGEVKVQAR